MIPTLRARREALGLTQAALAERAGTTQAYYAQVESGGVRMPNAELRRSISAALGIRHVDFLVAVGELEDWEVPGFDAAMPPVDPALEARLTLLREIDLSRYNRGTTLDVVLQQWAAEDRQSSLPLREAQ